MATGHVAGAAVLTERAPAKINLTLAVVGRRADGYHLLDSLVAFARVGDELTLTPGEGFSLVVRGPTAGASGDPAQNLVLRAATALADRVPGLQGGHFVLRKRLPVAAGLGGGSSDAGAALRLLARLNGLPLDDPRLLEAARVTGSDVPVCLATTARRMTGTGDILSEPVAIAAMPALLVNPRRPTPTGPVFKALALEPGAVRRPGFEAVGEGVSTRSGLLAALRAAANDLEPPAKALEPAVAEALDLTAADPLCRLARMSGSGATVFGLYDSCRAAASAGKSIRRERPDWWIATTMIG